MTAPTGAPSRRQPSEPRRAGPDPASAPSWRFWRGDGLVPVVLGVLAYVPLLLTAPGEVAADTKTYLYLDPGKLLRDAPYVWDSQIGLGTVTHQNIGYLWPMGPFYWVLDTIGLPDWVAQRLWLGSVLFAAGMGVRYLLRTLDWGRLANARGGLLVACLAYMLSPYLLDYSARISVILLPWAALPWLIAFTARSVRVGGWKYPALFALVVQTVGGINATALILIGVGPLLWLINAVWLEHEADLKRALRAFGRIAALTIITSLWWIAGLWAEGKYGLPVVRYTETYKTVAEVSSAPEVLRGLGYWFFYGSDKLGPWIEPSVTYTEFIPSLALSYLLPLAALVSAALVRWRHRRFFILLTVFGVLMAVASHPWAEPSPLGAIFKAFTRTDAGLAMRSTPRAVPLVVLGLAVFLGAGVSALGQRIPRAALPASALVAVLVVANLPTLWTGQMVAENLKRPEDIPDYWVQAADYLQSRDDGTRVLEAPGSDFASYRWGNTVDPVTPGLMDRPYVARELFVWGSPPSANLLNAFDRRFHENDMDPDAVAPMSRVMAAGDLTLRGDLQYERYRIARPRQMWDILNQAPGLGSPTVFGPDVRNVAGPKLPMIDEVELDDIKDLAFPPPVAVFPVDDALPIVRTHAATRPLLIAGDGDGVVDAASVGIIDPRQASFYAASYAQDPGGFDRIYGQGADLLLTDTNRKRARRWGTLRETTGYTEMAGETPLSYDPGDQRLALFPGAGDDAYTVTRQLGGATVRATGYGNPITFTPNDRAVLALDGDPKTAWRVGAVDDPTGQKLVIDLDHPVTTDHLGLLQPTNLFRNRWINKANLSFDGGPPVSVELGDESRTEPGQTVTFPEQTFSHLEIEISDTDVGKRPRYDGYSAVGFAEVAIPGVQVTEVVRPPTDLLDRAGTSSIDHRLTMVFTRLRSNPSEPVRTDEEVNIVRAVQLPTPRSFSVSTTARLSAYPTGAQIDRLLGIPDAAHGGVTADSDERLAGSLERRAYSAVDGDPTTYWSSIFTKQEGHHLDLQVSQPVTFDHLDLQVVADGRHSVPTRLFLVVDGDQEHPIPIDLPAVEDGDQLDHTVTVPITLPQPVTGSSFSFYVDQVREVETTDWYTAEPITMPVAIAELGIPGVQAPALPERFDSGCRDDLLRVDGTPIPLRVTGSTDDALHKQPLTVTACGTNPDGTVQLDAGDHTVVTGIGRDLGIDLDRLVFGSDAGGAPLPMAQRASTESPDGPPVTTVDSGRVSYDVDVAAGGKPFWLAIGQSWSEGWHATVDGHDLGPPQVIDGYGNGWLVDPGDAASVQVHVEWTPQRIVWVGIAISAVGVLVCLALIFWPRRRRRADAPSTATAVSTAGATHDGDDRPDAPALVLPGERPPSIVPGRSVVWAAVVLALFVFLDVPFAGLFPLAAVGVGLAVFLVFRWRAGAGWLALAGAASFAAAAAYIVLWQLRFRAISDFTWPLQYTRVHILGLLAVFLLLADGVREQLAVRLNDAGRVPSDGSAPTPAEPIGGEGQGPDPFEDDHA